MSCLLLYLGEASFALGNCNSDTHFLLAEPTFCQNISAHFQLDFEIRATEILWDERFREL